LQATALINEAYLRLAKWKDAQWNERSQFIGVAALVMRRLLVEHAKRRHLKPGAKVELEEALTVSYEPTADVVALDLALQALEKADPRKSRVVELRYFGGLSLAEIASVLQVNVRTVSREWSLAKAWLYHELSQHRPDES
jgi:RNA polymerase sigma factor (TIGR02999 family)